MAPRSAIALSLCLASTTNAARVGKKRQEVNRSDAVLSETSTTIEGCTCKPGSTCDADVGTKFQCDTCKTQGSCGTWSVFGRWGYCDYRPSTVESFISQAYDSKMDYFWSKITANTTKYPEYPLLSNFLSSVRTTFDNYKPEMPPKREKMIHTIGSVCKFDWQINTDSPYTGLLSPGRKRGFVRLGGALDPKSFGGGLTPGLGFKLPRSGVHDGDFVMLYSLAFGDQWDFFKLNQSNHLSIAEGFGAGLLVAKFKEATQCPTQVGLSDLARYAQDGTESASPKFPFKLLMVKGPDVRTGTKGNTVDAIHSEIDALEVGTVLYNVYACTKPVGDESKPSENLDACGGARLLGAIKTASKCTTSWYGDKSFHIRHQRIEEDWQLEPSYMKMDQYDASVACDARVDARGAPPKCGAGMLATDA